MRKFSIKNRTMCDTMIEMRDILGNMQGLKLTMERYSVLMVLLEELQSYANRTEAAVRDHRDVLDTFETYNKLNAAVRKKAGELRRLEAKITRKLSKKPLKKSGV